MLNQSQTIRALADALEWFEKELGWGVSPASLSHLTGRIGELYVAVTTRGQMASKTHQNGYDVVSAAGERISVKTITSSTHVSFNKKTFQLVDRVMVLRVNVEEGEPSIEEIMDLSAEAAEAQCRNSGGKLIYSVSKNSSVPRSLDHLKVAGRARFGDFEVLEYENGTIVVLENGKVLPIAKTALREIAREVGVDLVNSNGNVKNTRTLGSGVISALQDRMNRVPAEPVREHDRVDQPTGNIDVVSQMEACLVGGAVGDALGAEIEFWSLDQIQRAFPQGIQDLPTHDGIAGAITDDTQMTLFTLEGLIRAMLRFETKGICYLPGVIHHALLRWLDTQGETSPALTAAYEHGKAMVGLVNDPRLRKRRAPGNTCLGALRAASAFGDPAVNQSKGCGAIMRVAPLAFIAPDRIRETAEACSALTHGHETGQQAAAAWALILAGVAQGEGIEEAAGRQHGVFNRDVDRALEMALSAPRNGTPGSVEALGGGWVAEEALSIALYACLTAQDFESGLVTAVYHGGDSDSTGAIAGNALGLIYPDQVLAHRWSGKIECRDLMIAMARDFARAEAGSSEELWERYPGW